MRFIALLYADPDYYADLSAKDMQQMGDGYSGFHSAFAGHISLSEGVYPAEQSKILKTEGDELVVTDGIAHQGSEDFGGFYLIECRDIDDAIAIVAKNPVLKYGTVELRECTGPMLKPADDRYASEEKLKAYMDKVLVRPES
jgi:hypothetical protein